MELDLTPPAGYDGKPLALADADANPDEAASVIQLAQRRKQSPALVALDPPMYKRMEKEETASTLVGANPQLNRYVLNNPLASKVSADDYPNLNNTTRALQNLFGTPVSLAEQLKIENEQNELARENVSALFGSISGGYKSTVLHAERGRIGSRLGLGLGQPGDWDRAADLDRQMSGLTSSNEFGKFLGMAAGMLTTGWEGGLVGAGVGAGVGAVGGAPGVLVGAAVGGLRGWMTDQVAVAAGNHYINMRKQGVDEVPARLSALGVGAIQAALLKWGVPSGASSVILGGAKTIMSEAAADAASNAVLTQGVRELGKAGLTLAALGSVTELGNIVMEDLSKTFSTKDFSTVFNDPKAWPVAAKRIGEATASFMAMLGPLHIAGIGSNMYIDMLHIKQALEKKQSLDAAFQTAGESQTFARAPAYYEKFVAEHPEAQGDVGIPKDVVAARPEAFEWIPNRDDQLVNGLGDEVKVPFSRYLTYGGDVHKEIGDRVRIGDGLTEAEAKDLQANPPGEVPALPAPKEQFDAYIDTTINDVRNAVAEGKVDAESAAAHIAALEKAKQEFQENQRALPGPEITADPAAAEKFGEAMSTADQVYQAEQKANWLRGLFTDAKAAGMTAPEFGRYLKRIEDQQKAIYDKAYARAEREAKRVLSKEWKEEVAKESETVANELSTEPVHFADRYLRTGEVPEGLGKMEFKVKLDRDEVEHYFDLDKKDSAFREFSQQLGIEPPTAKDYSQSIFGKESVPVDAFAELFGFDSGRDLLLALSKLESDRREAGLDPRQYFDKLVNDEAVKRAEARNGSLVDRIAAEAKEAALGVKQLDVLAEELKFLQKHLGLETPISRDALEAQVSAALADKTISEARNWKTFERDTGRFGRQAELALLKQDYAGAFTAKQQQLLNLIAQKQSRALDKAYNSLDRFVTRVVDKKTIDGLSQEYLDQLQLVMAFKFGKDLRRDVDELMRGTDKTIEQFIEMKAKEGINIEMPEWMERPPGDGRNNFDVDKLPTSRFLDFKDFVEQMKFFGETEDKVRVKGEEVARKEVLEKARANAAELPQKGKLSDWKAVAKAQKGLRWWDANNLRLERFIDWLDKRDPNGVLNETLIKPMQEAQGLKGDLSSKTADTLRNLPRLDMGKKIEGGEALRDADGRPIDWTNAEFMSLILNMGARDNWQKLLRGYGWDENTVKNFVFTNATPEHWKFAKLVWKAFDDLFPDYEKAARATTGVGLKKVEGQTITLPDGTQIEGGYYPLFRDLDSITPADKAVGEFDLFKPNLPQRNSTLERTGAKYPVALGLDRLASKFEEIMHYSAFAEPVMNAKKIINDRGLKLAIEDAFGKEYTKMLPEWLEYIRSDGGSSTRVDMDKLAHYMRIGRQNAVVAFIGTKPGTAVIHGAIAASNSVREAGLKPMVNAATDILFRSPAGFDSYTNQIMSESAFMRNRSHNIDRDTGAVLDTIISDSSLSAARKTWATWATYLVRGLDQMSAVPTYLAAKRTALEKGMSDAEAIAYADKVVRNAHGSSGLVDLPAIMRTDGTLGGEMKGFTTMFGGTWNHNYNQLRDATRRTYDGEYNTKVAMAAATMGTVTAYLIAPAFIHGAVRVPGKPDEKQSWLGWGAGEIGNQLMSTQFGVRDIAAAMHQVKPGKFEVNPASPLTELANGLVSPLFYMTHPDKSNTDAAKRALLMAPTWWTGVGPTRYMADQMIAWNKINRGNTRPPSTFRDWWRMVLDARQPAKR